MRKIKFKIWDNELKKFHTDINKAYENHLFQVLISPKGHIITRGNEKGGDLDYISATDSVQDRFKLLQYTGLKDKNGVEIYEGDIVETEKFTGELGVYKKIQGPVEFIDGRFMIVYNMMPTLFADFKYQTEVIGNIYENPELLG